MNSNTENYHAPKEERVFRESLDKQRAALIFVVGFLGIIFIPEIIAPIIKLFMDSLLQYGDGFPSVLLNTIVYICLFVIIIIVIGWSYIKQVFKNINSKSLLGGLITGIAIIFGTMVVGAITSQLHLLITGRELASNTNESNVEAMIKAYPALIFLSIVILGPIVEEFTYRVGIFNMFKEHKYLPYILAIVIFALLHMNFYGTEVIDGVTQTRALTGEEWLVEIFNIPSYFLAGFIFSYSYDKYRTVSSPIIGHTINNLFAFIITLVL